MAYIIAIQDMYDGINTSFQTPGGKTDFPIKRVLH